ncbi:hypothetical protein FRC09_000960 [Ceratobasidium sp. 395]|nr:hypothetical protein FRC09_000960 [Ceratobasidium sp. 395]
MKKARMVKHKRCAPSKDGRHEACRITAVSYRVEKQSKRSDVEKQEMSAGAGVPIHPNIGYERFALTGKNRDFLAGWASSIRRVKRIRVDRERAGAGSPKAVSECNKLEVAG